jgi:hypothetical protein
MSPGRVENLIPNKPGEVRNPEGRNQYSYRRDAEIQLNQLLREKADGVTRSEQIIDRLLADAEKGKPYALKLVLDRILPAVTQHEHAFPESAGVGALLSRVAEIRKARRGNGDARKVEPHGANGGGGVAA